MCLKFYPARHHIGIGQGTRGLYGLLRLTMYLISVSIESVVGYSAISAISATSCSSDLPSISLAVTRSLWRVMLLVLSCATAVPSRFPFRFCHHSHIAGSYEIRPIGLPDIVGIRFRIFRSCPLVTSRFD